MSDGMKAGVKVRGSYRLQIEEDGKIVGDSGWKQNQVTNNGFLNFLVRLIGASAGSSQIGFVGLGTGGAPAAGDNVLAGEIDDTTDSRVAVTFANQGSTTARFTATFASANSPFTVAHDISNIGLFAVAMAAGPATQGTVFAGNTYASSSLATNQNANITYDLDFS